MTGGMNLSWFEEVDADWAPGFGVAGGFGIEFDLTYRTLLEIDLLYFQKGGFLEFTDLKEKHILQTVSVPVLMRGKFFYGSSPFLVGGVEISGVISYKARENGGEAVDLAGSVRRLDFGIVGGAGYEHELQNDLFIFLEMRVHAGLRNLFIDPQGGKQRKTMAIVLLFGVRS